MMTYFRRNSRIALLLVTALMTTGCGPITTEYCHKEKRILSNQELIDLAIIGAVEKRTLGDEIETRQQLFEKYPDCCFMNYRGLGRVGERFNEKGFMVQVSIFVHGDEPGLRYSVPPIPKDDDHLYELNLMVNECGRILGGPGSISSDARIREVKKLHEEIMEKERARRN